jgi:hypothetical protein
VIGINLVLWLAGAALLGLGIWRARAPFQRMAELDRLAENARRYDSWRGGRRTAAAGDGVTGADVMRQVVRRQAMLWAAVAVLGVVLLAAGFAVR